MTSGLLSGAASAQPVVPMKPLPLPNIRPKPMTQNASDEAAKTMKFFARMLTAFLARQRPLSTSAKPAFMKNTRNAAIMVQTVSAMSFKSILLGPEGAAASSAAGSAAGSPESADSAGDGVSVGAASAGVVASAGAVASAAAGSDLGSCAQAAGSGNANSARKHNEREPFLNKDLMEIPPVRGE